MNYEFTIRLLGVRQFASLTACVYGDSVVGDTEQWVIWRTKSTGESEFKMLFSP